MKLNRCYIKLSLVNILENVFVFIEILFKMLLFEGGVLIYAEHCKCPVKVYSEFITASSASHRILTTVFPVKLHGAYCFIISVSCTFLSFSCCG